MLNKNILLIFCMIFLMGVSVVSSAPPITKINSDTGLIIEPTIKDYLRTGEDHEFEIHVFNVTDGMPMISGLTCYMHMYNDDGDHEFEGVDQDVSHIFDYSFDLTGGNFTRGAYQVKFQCNSSVVGGGTEIEFKVNDYGEELTEAVSTTFNFSMMFMMILFLLTIVGMFLTENYITKFILYWISHLLFVIGSFSIWQFNIGYAIAYIGLAGVWKILFYVSIIAVVPMSILSMAWIFYIHTFNEHFQKLVDKGVDTEEAFAIAKRKSGGWFDGR